MRRIAAGVGRLVTVAAFLAALVTVVSLAAITHSGHQLYTVISGSMTPTFAAGDTVFVSPVEPQDLEPGMIVTFHAPGEAEHLTTHRILSMRPMPTGLFVQTKGDANEDADPNFTSAGNVVGEVGTIVPAVGHWLMFFQSPLGRILVLGTPLLLIAFGQATQTWRDLSRLRGARSPRTPRVRVPSLIVTAAAAVAVTLVAGVGGVALGKSTGAVYAATATASKNTFSTGLFCGQNDYATAVLADSPQQYHKFNETGTTSTAVDSSGNRDNASYVGGRTLGVAGAVCGGTTAVKLNGTSGYVSNTNTLPTLGNSFSVEAWVQTRGDGVIAMLDASGGGADRGFYVGRDGRAHFVTTTNSGELAYVSSPTSVADDGWHHLVVTATSTRMRIYVDGSQVASTTTSQGSGTTPLAMYGYAPMSAAVTSAPRSNYFAGSLDEVAVYNTTLSASRVLAHYRAGVPS